jgi:hypothetical protein
MNLKLTPMRLSETIRSRVYFPPSARGMRVMTHSFTLNVQVCCGHEFEFIEIPRKTAADVIRSWRKVERVKKRILDW